MSLERKFLAESGAGCGELIQCGESVAQHDRHVELARWLIESPEGFHVVGIQFEQLPDEALGNLLRTRHHQPRPIPPLQLSPQAARHRFGARRLAGYAARPRLTERVCFGMELDPKYVEVIVQRWQTLAGKKATLEGDGRTFEEIAGEREKRRREGEPPQAIGATGAG